MDCARILIMIMLTMSSFREVSCCPAECSCVDTTVNCSSRGLQSIPANIPTSATLLYLDHNEITSIDANDLSSLVNLEQLHLSYNKLVDIFSGAFDTLTKLQRLFLDNNDLTSLSTDLLDSTGSLTIFVASYNELRSIPNGIFDLCTILTSVDLSYNELDEGVFDSMSMAFWITNLDVSGNPIPLMPYLMLVNAEAMTTLVMSNANMSYLDPNSLLGMDNLNFLYLDNNNITSLKREVFQPVTSHISALDVTGNPLICDCDTKKFQDWLLESSVTFETMACYDEMNDVDIDVKTGNLDHLCTEYDTGLPTPPPTCKPDEACGDDALLTLMTSSISETSATLSWEYSDVSDDAMLEMTCRQHMGNKFFDQSLAISTKSFILSGLIKGTLYSCCALIDTCDLYTCTDFKTLGQDMCSHTEFIIAISILTTLLVIAIVFIVVLVLLKLRQDHRIDEKAEEILRNHPRWHSSQSSLVSVNNSNRITMISMGSMNSHLTNDSNVGRPLPTPKRESLYEHIPEAQQNICTDPKAGYANKAFSESDSSSLGNCSTATFKSESVPPPYVKDSKHSPKKKGLYVTKSDGAAQIKAQQMANIPGNNLSSQYLTPIDNAPRKPRRFVRTRQTVATGSEPDLNLNTSLPLEHSQSDDETGHVQAPPRVHSRSEGDIRNAGGFVNFNTNGQKSGSLTVDVGATNMNRSISQDIVPYLPPKKSPTEGSRIDLDYYQQIINGETNYDV